MTAYINDRYRLCYVNGNVAWFAPVSPSQVEGEQWGSDLLSESSDPHSYTDARGNESNDFRTLMFGLGETDRLLAPDGGFPVEDINEYGMEWLRSYMNGAKDLRAGAKMSEFVEFIEFHGGKAFSPITK